MDEGTNQIKQKITLKDIIFLQGIIVIYTMSGVAAKFASSNEFLSIRFVLFYGIEICILAFYALLWQQVIKKFDLSIAYANRSIALLWSMIWAAVFFHERITVQNIIGVLIVLAGTVVVNSDAN